jgi:hypothetical protein
MTAASNRIVVCCMLTMRERRLTTKAQPRRVKDVARVSGTDNAHRRWLQRFVSLNIVYDLHVPVSKWMISIESG